MFTGKHGLFGLFTGSHPLSSVILLSNGEKRRIESRTAAEAARNVNFERSEDGIARTLLLLRFSFIIRARLLGSRQVWFVCRLQSCRSWSLHSRRLYKSRKKGAVTVSLRTHRKHIGVRRSSCRGLPEEGLVCSVKFLRRGELR